MLRTGTRFRRAIRARSGIASIEFALVAPLLFVIMVGFFDAAKALVLMHQVRNAAHSIALSATAISVDYTNKTTVMTDAEAQQAMSLIFAEIPWIRSGVEMGKRSVTLTSINFKRPPNCTAGTVPNCYVAEVAFSVGYNGGAQGTGSTATLWQNPSLRSCGVLTQIGSTTPIPTGQTQQTVLPTAGVGAPDATIVADVNYVYHPFFLGVFTGDVNLWATDMQPVRIGNVTTQGAAAAQQYTTYSGSNGTGNCPNL